MQKFLKSHGVDLAIIAAVIITFTAGRAWAGFAERLPGPPAALLAGGAVIGTLVVAKWWRRK